MLAYRQGRFQDSVRPLLAAVNTRDSALTGNQVESALEVLGEAAAKTYRYGSSAQMYDDVDKIFGPKMGDLVKFVRQKRHIGALLQHVPAQTVRISESFSLTRSGDEYPVSVDGKSFSAQLDTGAAYSLLSESAAKSWGVSMLEGTVTLYGYGGGNFSARPGVIPTLQVGKAELNNVVVMVTADQNLYFAEIKKQMNALLGYPVASALGSLTFSKNGALTVNMRSTSAAQDNGAQMWVGSSSLLVSVDTMPVIQDGKLPGATGPRLFQLDTGGDSYFTDHYLAEHRNVFTGKPPESARLAGPGGIHEIPAYVAHQLPLWIGSTPVLCNGQHVLTQPQGGEAEKYYGVIGRDVLRLFSSYTIDFRNMRFSAAL